jgi:rhodanese-related sulfurtransferase
MGINVFEGTLQMNGCRGQFVVRFFNSKSETTEAVIQTMTSQDTKLGLVIMGSDPIDSRTKKPLTSYPPDNFLFRRNIDGSWEIINCDAREVCASVEILAVQELNNKSAIKDIETDALVKIIQDYPSEYVLIDARDEKDYDKGHIPTAVYGKKLPKDKSKLLIFYCWNEECGLSAAKAAKEAGYENVFTYSSGVAGWQKAGQKLVATKQKILLSIRSNVYNDKVYVDGEYKGSTGLDLWLESGLHSVRVEKDGYSTYEELIDLQKKSRIVAKLQRQKHENNLPANGIIGTDVLLEFIRGERSEYVLIDTREDSEYNEGHIPTAISIPFSRFESNMHRLPKNKVLIFYCWHETCGLSTQSAQAARQAGYKNVVTYRLGIEGWQAAGYRLTDKNIRF